MDRLLSESSRYFGEKRPAWLAPGALQGIEWCAGAPTAHRGNPIRSPAKWLRSRVVSPPSTRLGCFACATAATDSLALRARGEEEDNRTKPFDVMPPMGVDASCTGPCCCWLPGWGQRSPRWCGRSPRISCKGSHGLSLAITYGGRNGRRREVKCSGAGGALDVWNPTNAHLLLPACSERDMISPRPRSFSIFLFGC